MPAYDFSVLKNVQASNNAIRLRRPSESNKAAQHGSYGTVKCPRGFQSLWKLFRPTALSVSDPEAGIKVQRFFEFGDGLFALCLWYPTCMSQDPEDEFRNCILWGDWKRETWHRETGQHGTISQGWTSRDLFQCSSRCSLQVCLIQGVLYELLIGFVCSSISFCFTYCYVRQTKLASSLDNVWAHYKIVIDCVINW